MFVVSSSGDLLISNSINYGNMSAVLGGLTGISAIVSFIWLGGKPEVLKSTGKK